MPLFWRMHHVVKHQFFHFCCVNWENGGFGEILVAPRDHKNLFAIVLSFCLQAQRARSMGAIVYCVGVKEFNQTQVRSTDRYQKYSKYIKIQISYFVCVSVCFSSLQLLQTQWNMCFLYGEASKPSGESLTQYGTHIPHVYHINTHTHTKESHKNLRYHITIFFLFPSPLSQIIKKSCIEILAAEPSSVCAGGKRCEERGFFPF